MARKPEDQMMEDIIRQTLMQEQQEVPMDPSELDQMMELDQNVPQVSEGEMQGLMPEDEAGLFEAMAQMTGEPEEDMKAEEERDFFDNFIDDVDDNIRRKIANSLTQKVQADLDSRRNWEESIASTMKTLGVAQNIDKDHLSATPFDNASTVEFPMLIRAAVQYVSRSVPEIIPNKPAKCVVIGKSDPEREAQASRVEAAINYQLTYLDKGFYNDYRKGEFYKAICGSIFRKLYHDPITEQNLTRLVKPQDFIVHYEQVDLACCNRYTHRMYMSGNELRKMQHFGYYSDVDVGMATYPYDRDVITKEIDEMDGYDVSRANAEGEELFHTIYEVHCHLDIEGFEDEDEHGESTGIELPYIVTLDKDSSKILCIRRNWMPDDIKKIKQIWFVHYQFLPGTGFYGFGYAHLIGSIARAMTNLLRATMDCTALSLLKGGFKTEDAKIDGDKCIAPGEFRTVAGTFDDIRKMLYPLDFSPPDPQVLNIMQYLDKTASDIVQNTEVMLGSASNTGPVGTTLALIEQSQKIYSSIHQATHRSFGEELCLLAKLNFQYFPEQFEFASPDGSNFVLREDFDNNVRVIPVSDPNIASFQQRQAVDQATLQMAMQFPEFFKMDQIVKRMMTNLNVPALDEIMYTPEELEQNQQAQQEAAQAEQEAMMPAVDPLEAEMALQQQKIDGDLAKEEMKFGNEKELLEMEQVKASEMASNQAIQEFLNGVIRNETRPRS